MSYDNIKLVGPVTRALFDKLTAERDALKAENADLLARCDATQFFNTLLARHLGALREAAEDLADEAEITARVHGREYDMADLSNAAEHARAVLAKLGGK